MPPQTTFSYFIFSPDKATLASVRRFVRQSVGPSVSQSVGPSVRRSVRRAVSRSVHQMVPHIFLPTRSDICCVYGLVFLDGSTHSTHLYMRVGPSVGNHFFSNVPK